MIDTPSPASAAARHEIATIKAFLDRLKGDRDFRQAVLADPDRVEILPGLQASSLRPLWDCRASGENEWVQAFRDFVQECHRQVGDTPMEPGHPRMKAWRSRQIARLQLQIGTERSHRVRHLPAAFELSQGCSVGCWFCGVSAPKLSAVWPYTPANAVVWRELLSHLQTFVGPALGWAVCYWASDPLDNPDYEKFCLDFATLLGRFPSVTTALALKDPPRTRELLQVCGARNSNGVHFSILSLAQFHKVREQFTPQELLSVDLVPQYPGSAYHLAYSGKARSRERTEWNDPGPNTIACVSGWLINLVERSLRLITPCPADEEWPNGYQTLAYETFAEAEELPQRLETLAGQCMRLSVAELPQVALARGLTYERLDSGFRICGATHHLDFASPSKADYLHLVGELLLEARHPAEQMALLLAYQRGYSEQAILNDLETLFGYGIFEEAWKP